MQKIIWFTGGLMIGLTALSISKASIPTQGHLTDDTAIHQKLSEINVKKEARIDIDADISRLSKLEEEYHEKLPALSNRSRISQAIHRVAQQKYQYSGTSKK